MALTNFSIPFGGIPTQNWAATISPLQPHHATAVNNLLYGPAGHQESDEPPSGISHQDYYKNNPYSPPQSHQYTRTKTSNNYLPPPQQQSSSQRQQQQHLQDQQQQSRGQQYNPPRSNYLPPPPPPPSTSRSYGEGDYDSVPTRSNNQQTGQYFNGYNTQTRTYIAPQQQPPDTVQSSIGQTSGLDQNEDDIDDGYPERPPGFTRVQAGQGSRTQVHAILDYDADENDETDYYDEDDQGSPVDSPDGQKTMPTVTPIQGPIFVKNGTVPVVPLFSYPTINNGTFVQIPIWWTALSVALGLEISGDVIRGVPCVKRYHQLFCPTAGNSYPIDKIERFIDDNKALMRRMYGDFEMTEYGPPLQQNKKRKRSIDEPDLFDISGVAGESGVLPDIETGDTYFGKLREKRQTSSFRGGGSKNRNQKPNRGGSATNESTGRVDACESKIEIVTPYWASNSAGKIRAIVNTQHFEQAIHQEICTKVQTGRCKDDCGCEQKYKWHRLLAYDPDNDCKGIFMDWFLFPSCCVCRCAP